MDKALLSLLNTSMVVWQVLPASPEALLKANHISLYFKDNGDVVHILADGILEKVYIRCVEDVLCLLLV